MSSNFECISRHTQVFKENKTNIKIYSWCIVLLFSDYNTCASSIDSDRWRLWQRWILDVPLLLQRRLDLCFKLPRRFTTSSMSTAYCNGLCGGWSRVCQHYCPAAWTWINRGNEKERKTKEYQDFLEDMYIMRNLEKSLQLKTIMNFLSFYPVQSKIGKALK
jgi:hypothetical protein